jgi:hypothetical protein
MMGRILVKYLITKKNLKIKKREREREREIHRPAVTIWIFQLFDSQEKTLVCQERKC